MFHRLIVVRIEAAAAGFSARIVCHLDLDLIDAFGQLLLAKELVQLNAQVVLCVLGGAIVRDDLGEQRPAERGGVALPRAGAVAALRGSPGHQVVRVHLPDGELHRRHVDGVGEQRAVSLRAQIPFAMFEPQPAAAVGNEDAQHVRARGVRRARRWRRGDLHGIARRRAEVAVQFQFVSAVQGKREGCRRLQ